MIKKETLAQLFFYKFCELLKNTYFEEHLRTAAADLWATASVFRGKHNTQYAQKLKSKVLVGG